MIGCWKDARRIAKDPPKFNSEARTQAKPQAGLTPSIYDTVRFK
jgi:hypothetical protein